MSVSLKHKLSLVPYSCENEVHRNALVSIIQSYMSDPMGDCPLHNEMQNEKMLCGIEAHTSMYILLCVCGKIFAGAIVCFQNFSTFQAAPFLNIHDLAVLPSHRNMGIGSALLHGAKLYALRHQFCKVTLEVRNDNFGAQNLYSKLGFTQCTPPMSYLVNKL